MQTIYKSKRVHVQVGNEPYIDDGVNYDSFTIYLNGGVFVDGIVTIKELYDELKTTLKSEQRLIDILE